MNSTVKISDADSDLVSKGMLSRETAARLSRNDRETAVSVSAGFENPVFSLFLIDASGVVRFAEVNAPGEARDQNAWKKAVASLKA